jgi:dihydrodipicolinate synthase/N-acetylneuraminate lyase
MRLEERKRAAEIAVETSRSFAGTVIVQVGAADFEDSLKLTEHAADIGADAVSSLPPANLDEQQLLAYYKAIANAARLPLLTYYMPAKTGNIALKTMLQLLNIPGIIGLKITDWNLFYMKRILLRYPDAIVFNGMDECLFHALFHKVSGGIGMWYNIFPQLFADIYQAIRTGRLDCTTNF